MHDTVEPFRTGSASYQSVQAGKTHVPARSDIRKGVYLMTTENKKALVRRFYGEGVHNPALFDELLAPTYVLH